MVRLKPFGAAKIGLALLFALGAGYAIAATSIANTKHNLAFSGTGTGTIKAQSGQGPYASEICVFCHTPHFANTAQPLPLWNKQLTTAMYTTYTSDYLTSLGYPAAAPFVAGQKSRLCLSCHDGTVAIGAVYNLKGTAAAGTFTMVDGATPITTMPTTAKGFLDINLADDHPVGYEYRQGAAAGQDPELYPTPIDPIDNKVKLYPDPLTAVNKVECQSCHEPHDDTNKKFLRKSNVNGALCKVCHNKTNFGTSGHDTSTQTYNETLDTQGRNQVMKYACLACHRPHNGAGVPLTKGAEQVTCYEKGCHGANTTYAAAANVTQTWLNVQPEMAKTHAHPTNTISARHKDISGGESQTQLGGPVAMYRHAECYDCHNPHQVQPAVSKSTRGTLRISAALRGSWGVEPTWPVPPTTMTNNLATFATPVTYTKVSGAALTDEYQVCLKCHSNYVTLPAGARNLAAEINPLNSSYHGIVPGGTTNFYVNQNTMAQPWAGNAAYTAVQAEACRTTPANCAAFAASRGRVWCSDCHGSDATPAYPWTRNPATDPPAGPHGSNNNNAGPGTGNSDKMLIATLLISGNGTPLCLRCHNTTVYTGAGGNTRGTRHGADTAAGRAPQGCFSCHMWENPATTNAGTGDIFPHGMNKRWYHKGATTGTLGTGQMVDSFNGGWYTNMDYSGRLCYTTDGTGNPPTGSPCNGHNGVGY